MTKQEYDTMICILMTKSKIEIVILYKKAFGLLCVEPYIYDMNARSICDEKKNLKT